MVKNPSANAGDIGELGSIPGLGRFSGGGNGNPLQFACLENSMDRGVWWTTVKGSQDLGIIVQIGSFMEQALLCSRHCTKG